MMNDYDWLNESAAYPSPAPAIGTDHANTALSAKKRRRVFRTVIAIACCLGLMIGSGIAGAKIAERSFNAAPGGEVSQMNNTGGNGGELAQSDDTGSGENGGGNNMGGGNSGNDIGGGNGNSNGNADPLGGVNPGGGVLSLTELFIGADPAVVAISTEMTEQNVFGRTVTLPAAGSGFIISEDGYIVTNNHVVEDAVKITVLLSDGTKYPAVLVGRDPVSDVAVLKIDAKGLSFLTWGNSDSLQVGEQVAAIGNPLGEFANSMTVGYISALGREINIDGTPRSMLQTDAAVNSGNSGGPLLNLKGQVIGIVTAKSSGLNVEGLGFAIPSNKAATTVNTLIGIGATQGFGYVRSQAVMGVTVSTQAEDESSSIRVESVNSGSAAEKAGVKEGDYIMVANGIEVTTVNELKAIINELYPGDKLDLEILRDGKTIALSVILDEYTASGDAGSAQNDDRIPVFPFDGSEQPENPEDAPYSFWGRVPQQGGGE